MIHIGNGFGFISDTNNKIVPNCILFEFNKLIDIMYNYTFILNQRMTI